MDDRELERKLEQARREAGQFFAAWRFAPLREVVHRRTARQAAPLARRRPLAYAGGLVAAVLVFFLVWLPFRLKGDLAPQVFPAPGLPVAQYAINLDEGGEEHWLDFFRLTQPDRKEERLLAVIWKREPHPGGGYRALYSSLLGGKGDPQPTITLELPGSRKPLALISSRDREEEYLHYRVVGYNGDRITNYWEQDFVPGGQLEVKKGILVERRLVPDSPAGNRSAPGQRVTILIPYQIDAAGELVLPTEYLQVEVGQYLALIGADTGRKLQTFLQGTVLEHLDPGDEGAANSAAAQFYAARIGTASVLLDPGGRQERRRELLIEVVE